MSGNRHSGRPKAAKKLRLMRAGKPQKPKSDPRKFPYTPRNWPHKARAEWARLANAAKHLDLQGLDAGAKPGIKLIVALDTLTERAFLRLLEDLSDEHALKVLQTLAPLQIRLLAAYGLSPTSRSRVQQDAGEAAPDALDQLMRQAPAAGH